LQRVRLHHDWSARRRLEQAEARALRVAHDREASAWEVLRREHLLRTKIERPPMRGVDVLHCEVDLPVARHFGWHHRIHLPGTGNALSIKQELGICRLSFTHLTLPGGPAEDLLVER